jgi:DNA-directed RNA polymerase I subunit RPA43
MLSLVGSIQPDPFSPEHVPQAKLDKATLQSPRPSPRLLSELAESEELEEGLEETMTTREEGEGEETLATRGKKKREKEKEKVDKAKRKRKEDDAVAKSERKSKRKKTS